MKPSIFDVLSVLLLIGLVFIGLIALAIFVNPQVTFNPFPPPQLPGSIFVPTSTTSPNRLPPTWTPTPNQETVQAALPTLLPSSTPLPTNTPFILPSPTKFVITLIPTQTRVPLPGKCKVIDQIPKDDTKFLPKTPFLMKWAIQNTSGDTWYADSVDIRYKDGEKLHTGSSVMDMQKDVLFGETMNVIVEMAAPETAGYHITYWSLTSGDKTLCSFYVQILVEK